MFILKNLQLFLLCAIQNILYPFQIFRISFGNELRFGDICVHVTCLAHYILSLLSVFLNELISGWVDQVYLDLG